MVRNPSMSCEALMPRWTKRQEAIVSQEHWACDTSTSGSLKNGGPLYKSSFLLLIFTCDVCMQTSSHLGIQNPDTLKNGSNMKPNMKPARLEETDPIGILQA